jgi:6-phosphogluconolactonase
VTQLTSCPDAGTVAERAAAHVMQVVERAVAERGVAHVALSGGTTPGLTFDLLADGRHDLSALELWFADERCVVPEDPESNFKLASDTILRNPTIADSHVHRMIGELGPQEGASRYAEELTTVMGPSPGTVPVLDLVVLGIGPDGHVASLFPGSATLSAGARAICLPVDDSPKPPPQRITLSLAVLEAARGCLLLATGAGKADAVSAMLGDATPHVPASLLRRERLAVILDDAAAPSGPLT